jgi:aminopeptidase I
MTRNHPSLRKTASNADLYSDPSEPTLVRPHSYANPVMPVSALSRAHTTASLSRRPKAEGMTDRVRIRQFPEQPRNRQSIAAPAYQLIDIEEDTPKQHQNPPPVPPKIPEVPVQREEPKVARAIPSKPRHLMAATSKDDAAKYTKPFTDWMTANPTIFHAVDAVAQQLEKNGYKKVSERDSWELKAGGKYYVVRNGTSLIAFAIGEGYAVGNGAAIVAGHIDALTAKLKPIPKLRNKAGYVQLGVAPYAGALSDTWWDRDLGIGGRVLVKENGKIVTKLVKLDWPIARIPTLAPHFGAAANGPFNKETQMVPIIGLDNSDLGASSSSDEEWRASVMGGQGTFAATQPERLVKAISGELGITDCMFNLLNQLHRR